MKKNCSNETIISDVGRVGKLEDQAASACIAMNRINIEIPMTKQLPLVLR